MSDLLKLAGTERPESPPPPPEPESREEPGVFLRVRVHFASEEDAQDFAQKAGVHIGPETRRVWWPPVADAETTGGLLAGLSGDGVR